MRTAVPAAVTDSGFPAEWEREAPVAPVPAPRTRTRPPQQWVVWAEFVLFCLAPALGFCLARWWH